MKSIYIAGPMSGLPEFNFPAFFAAQRQLEAQGWKVWNPAAKDEEAKLDPEAVKNGDAARAIATGFNFRDAFSWDMMRIIEGTGIYMLKGWEKSPGARAEHAVATAMKTHYPDFEIMYQ